MSQLSDRQHPQLQQLMQQAKIESLQALSQRSGISERQLFRIQHGLLPKLSVESLLKLADALQISPDQLLDYFNLASSTEAASAQSIASLKQEYQRLQQQMEQQQETLRQEFQRSSLQMIESWLLQWPTAAAAAENSPSLPAIRLLPLMKPVEQLLEHWGVEKIGSVGEEVTYDPQQHQVIEGMVEPGDPVKVRYVGYRQGEKLLYRAKVNPVEEGGDRS